MPSPPPHALDGATLRALAAFADVEVDPAVLGGYATLPTSPTPTRRFEVDGAVGRGDGRVVRSVGAQASTDAWPSRADVRDAAVAQIWPEHFDLGTDVAVGGDAGPTSACRRVTASAPSPYLYVGPWSAERPGDAAYWNASFGALAAWSEIPTPTRPTPSSRAGSTLLAGA